MTAHVRLVKHHVAPDGSLVIGRHIIPATELPHYGLSGCCNDPACHACDPLRQRMYAAGDDMVTRLARAERRATRAGVRTRRQA